VSEREAPPSGETWRVLEVQCGACWASHREPCKTRAAAGLHVARWERALRRGLITEDELQVALKAALPVPNGVPHASAIVPTS
jgi:hypothetical protein